MKRLRLAEFAAILLACMVPSARASTIIYHDNFDGSGSSNLNGTEPDTDAYGGTNTWVANNGYKANGAGPTASVNQGAWLPFVPQAGNIYTLSASLTGIGQTGTGTSVAWYALGFTKLVPADPNTGSNRFADTPNFGRSWMLFRPNNPTGNNNMIHLGSATSGTATGPQSPASWTPATFVNGGDIDMQIVLDTSSATWTAAFYAKRPADSSYTQVSNGALNMLTQDVGAIGIARTTNTVNTVMTGTIKSFDLSVDPAPVPEPATSLLVALGAIVLGLARRKW